MTNQIITDRNQQKSSQTIPATFTCKIIPDRKDLPTSNKEWTRAKKCNLTVERDRLSFEDKLIRVADIEKATITIYQSALFFEYGILSITSNNTTNHFGIKYDDFWKGDLPFELERITKETPFLLFRKSLIILIIVYIFWEVIKK